MQVFIRANQASQQERQTIGSSNRSKSAEGLEIDVKHDPGVRARNGSEE